MLQPHVFWVKAAEWGRMITNGDPGACMYTFDENGIVQSEEHRQTCIDWLDQHCREAAKLNEDPEEDNKGIDTLIEYLRAAPIGQRPVVPLHVPYILYREDLPDACVRECSMPGQDASAPVTKWRETLRFTVHRRRARRCLEGYGAWEDEEIAALSGEALAEKILWLACNDFRERDLAPHGENGSDIFVLE
jgi:hypothetical protein